MFKKIIYYLCDKDSWFNRASVLIILAFTLIAYVIFGNFTAFIVASFLSTLYIQALVIYNFYKYTEVYDKKDTKLDKKIIELNARLADEDLTRSAKKEVISQIELLEDLREK